MKACLQKSIVVIHLSSIGLYCFFLSHCLLIQKGTQQWQTLTWAVFGIMLLFMGLRFLMWHTIDNPAKRATLRFLIGLVAGVVIFIG